MRPAIRCAVLALFLTASAPAMAVPPKSMQRVTARIRVQTAGPLSAALREQTRTVLMNRLNVMGVMEPHVEWVGPKEMRLILTSSGTPVRDLPADVHHVVQPGKLEFIWLKDVQAIGAGPRSARYLYEGGSRIRDSRTNRTLTPVQVRRKILYADPKALIVSNRDLKSNGAAVNLNPNSNGATVVVKLLLNEAGTRKMFTFTRSHIGALLAIVQDGRISEAPKVKDAIKDGVVAIETGNGTIREAQDLANILNAGVLPVPLEVVSVTAR